MSNGIPIKPHEVRGVPLIDTMPEDVYFVIIDAFNELITKHYNKPTMSSEFTFKDVHDQVKLSLPDRYDWNMEWFGVEEVYRDQGWIVQYEETAFADLFESIFVFKKRKS